MADLPYLNIFDTPLTEEWTLDDDPAANIDVSSSNLAVSSDSEEHYAFATLELVDVPVEWSFQAQIVLSPGPWEIYIYGANPTGDPYVDINVNADGELFTGISPTGLYTDPIPYDPDEHQFFRVEKRRHGVTILTSPDTDTWTEIQSEDDPSYWNDAALFDTLHVSFVSNSSDPMRTESIFVDEPPQVKMGELAPIKLLEVPEVEEEFMPDAFYWDNEDDPRLVTADEFGLINNSAFMELFYMPLEKFSLSETSAVWHFELTEDAIAAGKEFQIYIGYPPGYNLRIGSVARDVRVHDGVNPPTTHGFEWDGNKDRWLRYTELDGTVTWEAASEHKDWRVILTHDAITTEAEYIDLDFFGGQDVPAKFFSFNVLDEPGPPPTVSAVHPFVAVASDLEGNVAVGALIEIQTEFETPADVWLDREHTEYVSDPSTLLTDAAGTKQLWLPGGLYRWRSSKDGVESEWEWFELYDTIQGPQGAPGATGPQGPPGGGAAFINVKLWEFNVADNSFVNSTDIYSHLLVKNISGTGTRSFRTKCLTMPVFSTLRYYKLVFNLVGQGQSIEDIFDQDHVSLSCIMRLMLASDPSFAATGVVLLDIVESDYEHPTVAWLSDQDNEVALLTEAAFNPKTTGRHFMEIEVVA